MPLLMKSYTGCYTPLGCSNLPWWPGTGSTRWFRFMFVSPGPCWFPRGGFTAAGGWGDLLQSRRDRRLGKMSIFCVYREVGTCSLTFRLQTFCWIMIQGRRKTSFPYLHKFHLSLKSSSWSAILGHVRFYINMYARTGSGNVPFPVLSNTDKGKKMADHEVVYACNH